MTTYVLGSEDPELARLDAQAQFLSAPTQVLMRAAGIGPSMRVLDLGTGLGHVARAAAELVGPGGEVVGVDSSARVIEVARSRAEALHQVRYVVDDVTSWRDEEPFDVVVGRLILFHLPDPVAVLRHQLQALRPGGLLLMLDYDVGVLRAEPPVPFIEWLGELLLAAFRAAGTDPVVGTRLQDHLLASGAADVRGLGVVPYLPADSLVGPHMLAGVLRTLAPVMLGAGLVTASQLGLDDLPQRIGRALHEAGAILVPPALAGAWGRRPAA